MTLSCLPVSLYQDLTAGRQTLGDWFRLSADLGLDGADVSVAHLGGRPPGELDGLRREAADAGVRIAMLVTYSDFTRPDAGDRAKEVEEARRWIEAAVYLGAGLLRLTAGMDRPDVRESDGVAWAAEALTAVAESAAAAGIRAVYENHVRGATWDRNDFTQPAARFLDVVGRTRGSSLGVLFDTANNLALDEDPMGVLAAVADRVGAVHVSDLRRRGAFEPTTIGTGVAPIRPLLERVVSSGFDGWVSVEEASRTGRPGFERGVRFADRVWIEAGGRPRRPPGS
jgi:sugar phosphate isomerase/epimerase